MATSEESSEITRPRIGSHKTALCVVPPSHLCQDIDRLRANYDKSYGKWPAHINLIYPFVAIETLPEAIDLIRSKLVGFGPESRHKNIRLCLDKPNYFPHRRGNTVYITDSNENEVESFTELRSAILECFKNTEDSNQPHLTIGQSQGLDADSLEYLLAKASLLPPVQWQVEELVVLFRERLSGQDDMSSQMKVWTTINLSSGTVTEATRSRNLTKKSQKEDWSDEEETRAVCEHRLTYFSC
jgi:2'-5' RNA ligase